MKNKKAEFTKSLSTMPATEVFEAYAEGHIEVGGFHTQQAGNSILSLCCDELRQHREKNGKSAVRAEEAKEAGDLHAELQDRMDNPGKKHAWAGQSRLTAMIKIATAEIREFREAAKPKPAAPSTPKAASPAAAAKPSGPATMTLVAFRALKPEAKTAFAKSGGKITEYAKGVALDSHAKTAAAFELQAHRKN